MHEGAGGAGEVFLLFFVGDSVLVGQEFNGRCRCSIEGGVVYVEMVLVHMVLVMVIIVVKFNIRMIRKDNELWNVDNEFHLYGYVFMVFKVYLIAVEGVSLWSMVYSIGGWWMLR